MVSRDEKYVFRSRRSLDLRQPTIERLQRTGKTPRILQGRDTDRAVVGMLKEKLLNRERFHGQTWNYKKSGEPFLMNWHCYAVYGERPQPIYYVAEQEDVTELEALRMKERLLVNPNDEVALSFFSVLDEFQSSGNSS